MTGQQTRINGSSTLEMGNSNQELLSRGKKGKLTIVLIGVVILIALGVLVFFVFRSSPAEPKASALTSPVKSIELNKMLDHFYDPIGFNGTWVSDNEILYQGDGNIILYNVETNTSKIIYEHLHFVVPSSFSYELSADRKYLLVGYSYQQLYRYTFLAYYEIIDLQTLSKIHLADTQGSPRQVQLVIWAPVGNALAYVFLNDIYYWPSIESRLQEVRLTKNGRTHVVYNGVPDWVYEEEVFSSNTAMWFSKDGSKLAFASFNDSTTPVMSIPYYGLSGNFAFQYPQTVNIRYPKAGRPNPEVSLKVVDLKSSDLQAGTPLSVSILPPHDLAQTEPILTEVTWASDSDLLAVWMNRVQNKARVIFCSTNNGTCRIVMSIEETNGWVNLLHPLLISKDGKKMVLIYSSDQGGDAGKYRHLIHVDLTANNKSVPLTHGKFEVADLLKWDETSHEIYFLSTPEGISSQLRVNKVPDSIENSPHQPVCVSCDILTLDGKKCLYSGASFSREASYFALICAGPDVPEARIFHKSGKEIMVWVNNDELKGIIQEVTLPIKKEFTVPIAKGFEAVVQLHLPPNMDTSGKTKYPMLIHVYGGPDSNLVNERFSIEWKTYLVVNHSIIVGSIDGRNSGSRGDKIRFAGYRNFGTVEVEDTIYVTSYLQDNFKYIDRNRTAIWGWSYGGYTTVMALANDTKNIFKCGISVAPVTDWLYYDSIYTERYMGLPTEEDNLSGYIRGAVFDKIENLRNKDYFLVHGTLDDNVHYQQSMMLAKVLERNDILFRQQSYPDAEHSLRGYRPHFYHSLEQFLRQCFRLN